MEGVLADFFGIVACRFTTTTSRRGQTKPKSDFHLKQRKNSDAICSVCSVRAGCKSPDGEGDGVTGLTMTLKMTLFTNISHPASVFLLPGEAGSPAALSQSTVRIHETNHSSASWKQHLTAVVAMGILPGDHPQQGTGEVRNTQPTLTRLCFSSEEEEIVTFY